VNSSCFHEIVPKHKAMLPKMIMGFTSVILQSSTEIATAVSLAELTRISARWQGLAERKELEREWRKRLTKAQDSDWLHVQIWIHLKQPILATFIEF
jgi:hypothetical protein